MSDAFDLALAWLVVVHDVYRSPVAHAFVPGAGRAVCNTVGRDRAGPGDPAVRRCAKCVRYVELGPPRDRPARQRKRRDEPRSRTVQPKKLTRELLRLEWLMHPPVEGVERPRCRRDCVGAARPCPWVGCRYHLYLDITPAGSIKFNFPDVEPWELAETCALDVAERGGMTLEEVGLLSNLTRERIRQVELVAFQKLRVGGAVELQEAA